MGILETIEKKFETTFHKANLSDACTALNPEKVKDLLEHAQQVTDRAKTATAFANSIDALGDAGEKLGVAVKKINASLEKGVQVTGDVSAACQINEALTVLNKWKLNTNPSPKVSQEAAKAFDKLFGGAATYMKSLPPPANQYAQILEAISKYSFFSHMAGYNDPDTWTGPEGQQLRELERTKYQ